ncbi:hypothetical protein EV193_101229 [Herbihabitans rhizosphaerae]|uniref:Winged helix DNA-binding protein n=1 Tax=Herbihabitans rhizosphaerae TaxID=1872711 RepID=A0A4Q7L522_9PSEU|nr:hypothetical protein [Herbihabitans rhizosphaerae]RZS44354.1 hypothetical protein EV193_101229 [Herbihabitans rhizosphaerae]
MDRPAGWTRTYSSAPIVDLRDVAKLDSCRLAGLSRAEQGHLRRFGRRVFCAGQACPEQVVLAVHDLIREGLLSNVIEPGEAAVRIELTESGRAELARLTREPRALTVEELVCHWRDRPSPRGIDAEQRDR